ncbi:hypothetical protein [Pseudoalteromonas sp. S2893]|uniref:hypothetical protein n=1 Tax=Pseudoalteromonas sp. S2893 TaxID=579530 RepID=UPI00110BD490|nr:hypothetical protein [Pseudoalteromonas sp. S2893]TMP17010.1 hypothetical protein CWC04_09865 [Pseudoalteromonas sp. S2893]
MKVLNNNIQSMEVPFSTGTKKELNGQVKSSFQNTIVSKTNSNIYVEKIDALHKASGNFTKVVLTSTDKKQDLLKNINVGFAPVQDGSFTKIKGVQLVRVITAITEGKFNAPVAEYKKAKAASETKVSKDSYLPKFTPHGFKINGFHKIESTDEGLNTFTANGVFHADLDNIPKNELNRVWDALLTTKPFFMMVSPSKDGIKCFWLNDLYVNNDSYKAFAAFKGDRKAHMNMNRIMVKDLLKAAGIVEYYDQAPTNNNSLCYVSDDTRIHLDDDFSVYGIKQALAFINNVNKQAKSIDDKIKNVRSSMSELGASELKLSDSMIDARVRSTIEKFSNNTKSFDAGDGNGAAYSMACSMVAKGVDDSRIILELDLFKARFSKRPTWTAESKLNSAKANGAKPVVELEFNGADKVAFGKLENELNILSEKKAFVDYCLRAVSFVDKKVKVEEEKKGELVFNKDIKNLKLTCMTGLPATGKTFKATKDAVRDMIDDKACSLYILPDRASMRRGVEGSRYEEVIKHLTALVNTGELSLKEFEAYKDRVVTIFASDAADEEQKYGTVASQFDNVFRFDKDFVKNGGIVFMTFAGFLTVNTTDLDLRNVHLLKDDVDGLSTPVKLNTNGALWTSQQKKDLLNYFEYEKRSNSYKINGLSKDGLEYYVENEKNGNAEKLFKRVEEVKTIHADNKAIFYTFKPEIDKGYNVYKSRIIDVDTFVNFGRGVTFIGDSVQENPIVRLLTKAGVNYQEENLKLRIKNFNKRAGTVYYVTEHNMSKTKMNNIKERGFMITNAIKKEFAGGRKALLCVNNDQLQDGELARDLEHHFDLTSVPANTKGRNDLKENDLILGLFRCDLPIDVKLTTDEIQGLGADELENWIQINLLLQAFFRGVLRYEIDDRVCDIVVPNKAHAEAIVNQIFLETGVKLNTKCLDENVSKSFENGKRGVRPLSGDKAMDAKTKNTRRAIKKKVDAIDNSLSIDDLLKFYDGDFINAFVNESSTKNKNKMVNNLVDAFKASINDAKTYTEIPEGIDGDLIGVSFDEDSIASDSHELTLLTGINDSNNESIDNNKIYDELFNQDAANDPVIEQPIEFKKIDNSQLINFG